MIESGVTMDLGQLVIDNQLIAMIRTFVAGVPDHDPEVVCLIQVRKPNKRIAYYGAAVAAPAVRAVLAYTLPYLGVPPDEKPPGETTTSLALDRR